MTRQRGPRAFIGSLCDLGADDYHAPYVYFAEDPVTGLVKVGTTTKGRMLLRMRELYHALGHEVVLLAMMAGGIREERSIHRALTETRERGEWFRASALLDEYIRRAGGRPWSPDALAYWGEWAEVLS